VGNPASRRRLETRFLVHEVGGWAGYTYVWNANGTDADLLTLPRGLDRTYTIQDPSAPNGTRRQTWHFPSMSECMQCHTHARGHVLGVRTGQLNVAPHMAGQRTNHLERFNDLHMFTQDIGPAGQYGHWFDPADGTRTDGERARSYLAANCAHCHLPGGPTQATFDVRFRTPDAGMHAIGVRPNFGMGLADPYIIEKNDKNQSVLWVRMGRLDNTRMPKIGSEHGDAAGVELIGRWIDGMRWPAREARPGGGPAMLGGATPESRSLPMDLRPALLGVLLLATAPAAQVQIQVFAHTDLKVVDRTIPAGTDITAGATLAWSNNHPTFLEYAEMRM